MAALCEFLGRFACARRGSVMVWFALTVPLLAGAAAAATNYAWLVLKRTELQSVADSAATGAARELALAGQERERVVAVARQLSSAGLTQKKISAETAVDVIDKYTAVKVGLSATVDLPITLLASSSVIDVTAIARLANAAPVCMMSLDQKANRAMYLQDFAQVTAPGCGVFDNSDNAMALWAQGRAAMRAMTICSSGGVFGASSFTPTPITDCPVAEDPLAYRKPPTVDRCDHTETVLVTSGHVTLNPGFYCGGIQVLGGTVKLNPGIYAVRFGVAVNGGGTLIGNNVSFYLTSQAPSNVDRTKDLRAAALPWMEPELTRDVIQSLGLSEVTGGNGAGALVKQAGGQVLSLVDGSPRLYFATLSTIDLSAPKDGPLAGILVFEDRRNTELLQHQITSDNAHNLLGTIYLSRGALVVAANRKVADGSAYTIIVARRLYMSRNANLVLNRGYDKTEVPVPEGVGPSRKVYLSN